MLLVTIISYIWIQIVVFVVCASGKVFVVCVRLRNCFHPSPLKTVFLFLVDLDESKFPGPDIQKLNVAPYNHGELTGILGAVSGRLRLSSYKGI